MTINPGIAELLSSHDGLTTVKNSTFNPYSDYSFTGTDLRLPIDTYSAVRFSVYCANWSTASDFKIGMVDTESRILAHGIYIENGTVHFKSTAQPKYKPDLDVVVAENLSNGFHDFAYRIWTTGNTVPTRYNYIAEVDNRSVPGLTPGAVISTQYQAIDFPPAANGTFYVSNLMFDNRTIYSTEKVYSIPLNKIGGNMTEEGGFHIASNANDSLQMEVNYSDTLVNKVGGGKVRVTNVMLVGNPAYRVGDTLTKLSASHKVDSVSTFSKALSGVVFYESGNASSFANTSFIFTAS